MDFTFEKQHQLLRHAVPEFAQQEIAPRNREIEETHTVPVDLRQQMAELGFFGAPFATKYGGAGAGPERMTGGIITGGPGQVAAELLQELKSRGLALRTYRNREKCGASLWAAIPRWVRRTASK